MLKQVQQIYEQKFEEETRMDTEIVKNDPKRIIVFVLAKEISLAFTGVEIINSIAHLERLPERLSDLVC